MEIDPSQVPATAGTGEWPAVPPAPAPVRPTAPALGPEPPIINADIRLIASPSAPSVSTPTASAAGAGDDPATGSIPVDPPPPRVSRRVTRPLPAIGLGASASTAEESPLVTLQRTMRRQQALGRNLRHDLVWQPRFAYTSALVIVLALTVVSMPLWVVVYRVIGAPGQTAVGDLVALCMMLLGGLLTGAAAWVIIIEMRGRVRMVDTLARSGEREVIAAPEIPSLESPLDHLAAPPLAGWEPGLPPPPIAARVEAQQVSAAATLEASGKLLSSFASVLKNFGQLPAEVAMLTVALALFVGATVLSLH